MRIGLALLVMVLSAAPAKAQTGPQLLLKPWPDEARVEVRGEATFFGTAHGDSDDGEKVRLQIYESGGRAGLGSAEQPLNVGYQFFYMNIDSSDVALPQRLTDQQFGVGFNLCECSDGWTASLTLGGGFAGDLPYADSDAWYGRADLFFTHKIDDRSSVQILVNYHGNRSVFPDVPLPAVSYSHKHSDTLTWTLGVPYSGLFWVPADKWFVNIGYVLPFSLDATIGYELFTGFTLFGGFHNRFEAFHLEDDSENRRLFFEQRQLEAGLTWKVCKGFDLTVAGGYAFGQEFSRGWDARDTTSVRELSDEPYIRGGVLIRF